MCVFGADVNAAEQDRKWTPLHFAVDSKHPKMVSMLLRRGADVQREDEEKCVPELLARRNRASECQHIITKHVRERTELLGKQAADVSAFELCVQRNPSIVDILGTGGVSCIQWNPSNVDTLGTCLNVLYRIVSSFHG